MKQTANTNKRVVILGASPKTERYSWQAFQLLEKYGYEPIPVHPAHDIIGGRTVCHSLDDIEGAIDTVTLYVNPSVVEEQTANILKLHPRRVIMNPGSEHLLSKKKMEEAGIEVQMACSLVLLKTGQF